MYNKERFTKLTLDQPEIHIEYELPYVDLTTDDMIQALKTLMIAMTFSESTFLSGLANYLREHADDLYDVQEINYEGSDEEPH